ncbi:Endonuclease III [Leptospira interrogans]
MARRCEVTGRGTVSGNNVSHSHIKTRRTWKVNLIKKRIFLEDENRWVTIRLSTRALRTLRKKGIKAAIKDNGGSLAFLLRKNTQESQNRHLKKPDPAFLKWFSRIFSLLRKEFGKVSTPLHFQKDYELAIAVILSAQCTDERVNQVTPALFKAFPTLESFASSDLKTIETLIFSTGFYRNKAKSIQGFAKKLLNDFDGKIPKTIPELITLPGFGRKTANVVLSEVHGLVEGIVVDTHVNRLSKVLGLTTKNDPVQVEKDLMSLLPEKYWRDISLYLIFLGRKSCKAHRRFCEDCILKKDCPSSSIISGV